MKIFLPDSHIRFRDRGNESFTLTEVMVASAVFCMVILGVVYSHIMGLKMYEITKAKLGASDMARGALSTLICEVRSAKSWRVGDGTLSTFTQASSGSNQQGTAVQIYPTTNTSNYIRYYFDSTDKKLRRTTNGATYNEVIAQFIIATNNIFTSEDYNGTILTDGQNNRVLGVTLQFYQIQYPITYIGTNSFYDFYQLRSKIAMRCIANP